MLLKYIETLCLSLTITGMLNLQAADEAALTAQSTEDDYVKIALKNNASLKAAYHSWQAERHKVPQVRALPDPRVTVGYSIDEVETRVGAQKWSVSLSQKIPWFGKLRFKEKAALKAAQAKEENYQSERSHILFQVKKNYANYYLLKRKIDVTEEHLELLSAWEKILQNKYATASASHADLLKTQIEMDMLNDRLIHFKGKQAPLSSHLKSLLNLRQKGNIPFPESKPKVDKKLNQNGISTLMKSSNHELRALNRQAESREYQLKLAHRNRAPDPTLSLKHIETDKRSLAGLRDNGKDPLIASLSFNIPFGNRYAAAIRESKQEIHRIQSKIHNQEIKLKSDLEEAFFNYEDAKRKKELYSKNLIPKIEQTLEVNQSEYQSGQADYFNILENQRTLLEFYLTEEEAHAHQAIALATIEKISGQDISKIKEENAND